MKKINILMESIGEVFCTVFFEKIVHVGFLQTSLVANFEKWIEPPNIQNMKSLKSLTETIQSATMLFHIKLVLSSS